MANNGAPDCTTCWKRDNCIFSEEGMFCPGYQRAEPEARAPDPNVLWRQGEEAVF